MADTFNVDAWVAGLEKPRRPVKIYQRPDLAGQIEYLQSRLAELPKGEESLGGGDRADIEAQIDELAEQFHDSAATFWVQALGPDEMERIADQVRKDLKDRADKVAEQARKDARVNAKRLGVDSPTDINRMVRETVQAQTNAFVGFEISLRFLAEAIAEPKITADQLRTVAERLGRGQIDKLERAFQEISDGTPEATVPKSSRRGTSEKEQTL